MSWGTPTERVCDGFIFLTHKGTEKDWNCRTHDPDVTVSLRSLPAEDAGSTIFNNRLSFSDMMLRCVQLVTLSQLIQQTQKLSDTPTPLERDALHRWAVATGDFNMKSDDRNRFYPRGTLELKHEDSPGYLPPDVHYLELGVSFVRH